MEIEFHRQPPPELPGTVVGAREALSRDSAPGFIVGRRADVLAVNPPACVVLTDFGRLPAVRRILACGLSVYRS